MLGGCIAAAAAVVVDDRRIRLLACALALLLAPVLVLGDVWTEARVVDFRNSPSQVGTALVLGVAGLAALTALFRRYEIALPIAALAVLPLRVPVEIGGETANLLVPLYLVIAAGVLSAGIGALREGGRRDPPAEVGWPRIDVATSTWLTSVSTVGSSRTESQAVTASAVDTPSRAP